MGHPVIRFTITTYPGATGANLAKAGHYGNIPHTSVAAAEKAAEVDAAGEPFTISYERGKRGRTA